MSLEWFFQAKSFLDQLPDSFFRQCTHTHLGFVIFGYKKDGRDTADTKLACKFLFCFGIYFIDIEVAVLFSESSSRTVVTILQGSYQSALKINDAGVFSFEIPFFGCLRIAVQEFQLNRFTVAQATGLSGLVIQSLHEPE
jgi:hypothetical protein